MVFRVWLSVPPPYASPLVYTPRGKDPQQGLRSPLRWLCHGPCRGPHGVDTFPSPSPSSGALVMPSVKRPLAATRLPGPRRSARTRRPFRPPASLAAWDCGEPPPPPSPPRRRAGVRGVREAPAPMAQVCSPDALLCPSPRPSDCVAPLRGGGGPCAAWCMGHPW